MISTSSNYIRILRVLGVVDEDCNSPTVRVCCPVHCGSDANCVINLENGCWKCWSHGCNEIYGSDIIGLIAGVKQISRKLANQQFNSLTNSSPVVKQYKPKITHKNRILKVDFSRTKFGSPYFLSRGIMAETLRKFNVFECNDKTKNMYDRAIAPIYDENNSLVGFTGRDKTGQGKFKWLHLPREFKKSVILYNLNNAKYYIQKHKTAILVEGPIDVWRLDECSIYNAVAMLGTDISLEQIELLKKYGAEKIILLLDPDSAGLRKTMSNRLFNKLSKYFEIFSLRHLLKTDVGDTPMEELNSTVIPEIYKIVKTQ